MLETMLFVSKVFTISSLVIVGAVIVAAVVLHLNNRG